jgi:hypothetical protein
VATLVAAARSTSQYGAAKMAESIAGCFTALERGKRVFIAECKVLFVWLKLCNG